MQESLRLPRWGNFRGIDVHVVLHFALSRHCREDHVVNRPGKIDATSVSSFAQTQLRLFDVEIPEKWNLSSLRSIAALLGELLCGFFIIVLWLVVHRACCVSLRDGGFPRRLLH